MNNRPIIAIIGRPNVGKSTFFNRLIGRRNAITSETAGTTRDRHFSVISWFGHTWTIIDTAGILFGDESQLEAQELQSAMEEQVKLAVNEAAVIAFVVDVKEGVQPNDQRVMQLIRRQNKPVVIIANKSDNPSLRTEAEQFSRLGGQHVFPVSSIHGTGVNDFIDYLIETVPSPIFDTEQKIPRVTFIGRPNVGKSSIVNKIVGDERVIVSELPGTTRDSIEETVELPSGESFVLVDTAGIRRRGKIEPGIERYSLFRALRAINRSDIVVHLLTIEEPPTRGDAHITSYALEAGKKVILLLNKTDLARDAIFNFSEHKRHNIGQRFLKRFPFMQRLPYYFVSAKSGQGIPEFTQKLTQFVQQTSGSQPK